MRELVVGALHVAGSSLRAYSTGTAGLLLVSAQVLES